MRFLCRRFKLSKSFLILIFIVVMRRWHHGKTLKLVDQLHILVAISHLLKAVSICISKAWIAIDRLSTIWKSNFTDKIKWEFFPAVAVSVLLYGCITLTLTKHLQKKLDGNCTRMLCVVLNKPKKQQPSTAALQSLTSHLANYPSETKIC